MRSHVLILFMWAAGVCAMAGVLPGWPGGGSGWISPGETEGGGYAIPTQGSDSDPKCTSPTRREDCAGFCGTRVGCKQCCYRVLRCDSECRQQCKSDCESVFSASLSF